MERHELVELHFITPIANHPSIMAHGILCHRRAAALAPASLAMAEVQDRRRVKKVPQGRGLHEHANLYVNARNPMLYKRLSHSHEICVLSVSPDVLDIPGTVVTDQNAATGYVRLAAAPEGFSIVDRAMTFATYWTHPEDRSPNGGTRFGCAPGARAGLRARGVHQRGLCRVAAGARRRKRLEHGARGQNQ